MKELKLKEAIYHIKSAYVHFKDDDTYEGRSEIDKAIELLQAVKKSLDYWGDSQ